MEDCTPECSGAALRGEIGCVSESGLSHKTIIRGRDTLLNNNLNIIGNFQLSLKGKVRRHKYDI